MTDKMTPEEFIKKCEEEGGKLKEGFDYGLRVSDLDDSDLEFNNMVEWAEGFYLNFKREERKIYDYYGYFTQ